MKTLAQIETELLNLQSDIRVCHPDKLGLIVLALIDLNCDLLNTLRFKETCENSKIR